MDTKLCAEKLKASDDVVGNLDSDRPYNVLALFDFDGTITSCDSYTPFLLDTTPKWRIVTGFICLFPVIIFNKFGLCPSYRLRPMLTWFATRFRNKVELSHKCELFAKTKLAPMIRPSALEKINWHRSNGHRVVIVSATVKNYLEFWCKLLEVECLASELESRGERLTGHYVKGDCHGTRKVDAIRSLLDLGNYSQIYAYGDTNEDLPMLALANFQYYRGKRIKYSPVERVSK